MWPETSYASSGAHERWGRCRGGRAPAGFPRDAQAQFKLFGGAYWYEGRNMDDTLGTRAGLVMAGLPGVRRDATLSFATSLSCDNEEHLEAGPRMRILDPGLRSA